MVRVERSHAMPPNGEVRSIRCPDCKGFGRWLCALGRKKYIAGYGVIYKRRNFPAIWRSRTVVDLSSARALNYMHDCPLMSTSILSKDARILYRVISGNHPDTNASHEHFCLTCNHSGWITDKGYAKWVARILTR